jgi:hypothetical protein
MNKVEKWGLILVKGETYLSVNLHKSGKDIISAFLLNYPESGAVSLAHSAVQETALGFTQSLHR